MASRTGIRHACSVARSIALAIIIVPIMMVMGGVLYYSLPIGQTRTVEGEILYRVVDFQLGSPLPEVLFHTAMGHRRLELVDGSVFYICEEDERKIWNESPFSMRKKGYTNRAVLEVTPVPSGRGPARLKQLRRVPGVAAIVK